MSEPNKQYTGDGSDSYIEAARKSAEAVKQIGQSASAATGTETAANAASAAQASMESGKAAAEIATGTAAGGSAGAVISAAWALRHTLFKVLVTICLFLLFIITMIVSLPAIVFNGIFHTDPASVDPGSPTEMFAIYEEQASTVSSCVTAGYDYAKAETERVITDGGYDDALSKEATIDHGLVSADYDACYILAAYSVSMGQKNAATQDLRNKLTAVAPLMFPVTYEIKETIVTIPAENAGDEPTEETVQYVQCTIQTFDVSVILPAFSVDPDTPYGQFNVRTGDVIESMATALKRTLYGVMADGKVPPITDVDLTAFLENLTCSPARKELMRAALSLVGRVPYFWGGKSAPGWNDEWNTPRLVTSAGSGSTGTLRPYGLDCSGYTDWVYKTALGHSLHSGSWSQWDNSEAITESDLLPGDLGFLDKPGAVAVNHMLLYAGTDASGKKLWVHCSSGAGGVALNSPTYVKYYRRVTGVDLEHMPISSPVE
ncbi:MAG: C40 family peptidase [Peptococcaceae bacterium]|jgi:cell wall-associated NlpC family hydrolase|nr:C40 family peptidase [Peptococcaceae bacterium]